MCVCVYIYLMNYMYANREEAYKRGYIYKEAKHAVVSHHTISLSTHMNIYRDDGSKLIERIL